MSEIPAWLDPFPALQALARDPASEQLGLQLLSEEDARSNGASVAEYYAGNWHLGVLWSPELWTLCQQVAAGLLQVCTGPSMKTRMGIDLQSGLYVHPDRPDEVLLAPSTQVPCALWAPVPARIDDVRAALSEFFPQRRVPWLELPKVERAFMGYLNQLQVPSPYSGELEMAGPHELDRHWNFSPFVDATCWGSAYVDDPWPEAPLRQIEQIVLARKTRAQREGGLCRFTRRTLFSSAQLTTELHGHGRYVWEARYIPSRFSAKVIDRLNQKGAFYPTDMPLDLVGATLGFEYLPAAQLQERLREQTEPGLIGAYIDVLCAVRHSDLRVVDELRPFLDHPALEVRAALANAAMRYNWRFLIEDLALREGEGDFLTFLSDVMRDGIAPPQMTEMGEPTSLYDGMQDPEENDEDEEEAE